MPFLLYYAITRSVFCYWQQEQNWQGGINQYQHIIGTAAALANIILMVSSAL